MSLDAMKQALEALEECTAYTSSESWSPSMTRECEVAITALRAAIEQTEKRHYDADHIVLEKSTNDCVCTHCGQRHHMQMPISMSRMTATINAFLEAHHQCAAPRQWQGLTDEELNQIYAEPQTHAGQYARAIEAKLKEKNT